MDKKTFLYGTPLNKILRDDQPNDVNSFSNRKTRINQLQTVRDSFGRQRFHGAFTGGYSAGYFNTVDTAEGFRPKSFISRRGDRTRAEESQQFSHKPEDYMDDEDFGEFGIAPKKIRVTSEYSNIEHERPSSSLSSALIKVLMSQNLSVGWQILHKSRRGSHWSDRSHKFTVIPRNFDPKSDFHGLGYRPLRSGLNFLGFSSSERFSNPLTAVLKTGKRLKISGEAFGSGVLDEDEDCLELDDAHGYDDIRNYKFLNATVKAPSSSRNNYVEELSEHDLIPGFVLAKGQGDVHICDDLTEKYPPPIIPEDWKVPSRIIDTFEVRQKLTLQGNRSSSVFDKKFAAGSNPVKSDIMETKAGLVLYSDLKAVKPSIAQDELVRTSRGPDITKATIVRQSLEWRPCSLLCKHFNVPNPYPDNSFVGTKPERVIKPEDLNKIEYNMQTETHQELASYELKRAIFDVTFDDQYWRVDSKYKDNYNETILENEDDPQVVLEIENKSDISDNLSEQKGLNEDSDIIIVPAPKPQEPEVIELLSSSSSTASPPQSAMKVRDVEQCRETEEEEEEDSDIYGPPLPPTLKTSSDSDHRQSSRHRRSSKQRKKSKKHKRKK